MRREWFRLLSLEVRGGTEGVSRIRRVLTDHAAEIQEIEMKPTSEAGVWRADLNVKLLSEKDEDTILEEVVRLEGVGRARWS